MSRRNFILLIIVLIIIILAVFGFLYFRPESATPTETSTGTNFLAQFNPFKSNVPASTNTQPPVDISDYVPAPEDTSKLKLVKVSSMGVAGFTVFQKERLKDIPPPPATPTSDSEDVPTQTPSTTETTIKTTPTKPTPPPTEFAPALRYVDRTNGNIYQTFADKIVEKKFSTTLVPKVYDAYFGNRGESVAMRYLKTDRRTIETFIGNLPKELLGGDTTEENEIKGSFLPDNIKDVSISPDATKIFYLFKSGVGSNENTVGTILNLLTNKKIQIFDSPFTEWLSFWPNSNIITLSTKPSALAPGYMYTIEESGKNLTKVLGDISGLTTLMSPNGKLILYGNSGVSLSIYNTTTRDTNILSLNTLPEKCVWSKTSENIYCAVPKIIESGLYPDSWYQGEVSFSDQFWKIDVLNGNTTLLLDPAREEGGGEIDGVKLALDGNENFLFFINKKDSFLWRILLKID